MRKYIISLCIVLLLITPAAAPADEAVRVGSKNFTEQVILGKIMVYLLKDRGIPVVDKTNLGGTKVNRQALEQGQIDVYMEYTGTAWINQFKQKTLVRDPFTLYEKVKTMDAENSLIWLPPAKFNNTYAITMKTEKADKLGIVTLADWSDWIKKNPGKMTIAVGAEFYSRPDGFKGMISHYGLVFGQDLQDSDVKKMEISLSKKAVRDGRVRCGMAFATDGEIKAYGLTVLTDDKHFFPIYNPAPVVRKEILDKFPRIKFILSEIGPSLDTATMTRLNLRVNINGEKPDTVAKSWLKGVGLIISKRK